MGTADGFVPMVARWWADVVEVLEDSGEPWPEGAAAFDLRWWEDYARHKANEGVRFPGSRFFSTRWNWPRHKVRRFIETREQWADSEVHPVVTRSAGGSRPVRNGSKGTTGKKSPGKRVRKTRSSPASLSHMDPPEHTSPARATRARGSGVPRWVQTWLAGDGSELASDGLEVLGGLSKALEAIRGRLRPPSESAARPVLRLWREVLATSSGPVALAELVDVVERLARACRECPDPMFRNDVRGIDNRGDSWKGDASRAPSAVCRLGPPPKSSGATWEDRLAIEAKWATDGHPLDNWPPRARRSPDSKQSYAARAGGLFQDDP